jgi:hypothetical protein
VADLAYLEAPLISDRVDPEALILAPVVREVRAGRRKALDRADPADLKVLDLSDRWAAI